MTLILNGTDNSATVPAVQGGTAGTSTGLYYPTTNAVGISTAGTNAVYIDASQKVGIGTSSPTAKLVVSGGGMAVQGNGNPTTGAGWEFYTDTTTASYAQSYSRTSSAWLDANWNALTHKFSTSGTECMRIDSSGNVEVFNGAAWSSGGIGPTGKQLMLGYDTTNSIGYVRSANNGTAYTPLYLDGSFIRFNTGTSTLAEAARIDSSGNLLVGGTATNPIASRVNGFATGPVGFLTLRGSTNMALGLSGTSGSHIQCYTDNGTTYVSAGSITSSGSVTAFNVTSDYRLKQNVQPMTSTLSLISQLKPCSFEYIEGNQYSEGFIAHELQAIVPHAVTGEKDAIDADGKPVYQGVDSSFLIPHLVAAIQEQQALITSLTARIAALEAA